MIDIHSKSTTHASVVLRQLHANAKTAYVHIWTAENWQAPTGLAKFRNSDPGLNTYMH
jgi:hypothetical protein